ncbi:hypothetical protein AALB16_12360 [Lachnospiraceae bacterium 62-35]
MNRKKYFYIAALLFTFISLSGCSIQEAISEKLEGSSQEQREQDDDEDDEDRPHRKEENRRSQEEEDFDSKNGGIFAHMNAEEESDASSPKSSQARTINNGGTVVRYKGNDYYWKYSSDSVEPDGLFNWFYPKENVENQLACRYPDGTEEILFTAIGKGDIYIVEDRIYMSPRYDLLQSVDLSGGSPLTYENMELCTANDEAGTVIVKTFAPPHQIHVIDGRDGSVRQIYEGEAEFVDTAGEYAYFSLNDTNANQLALLQLRTDGSGEMKEIDRFSYPPDYGSRYSVLEISLLGDILYYSYGFYDGTGGYFQIGGINSVKTDGSDARVCIEPEIIHAEEFLAEETGEGVLIYYVEDEEGSYISDWSDYAYSGCTVKNLKTGLTEKSSFPLSRQKSYVYLNGAVSGIMENKAVYETLIPQDLASSLGCTTVYREDADTVIIRNLERIGGEIYFVAEKSRRYPEGDVGWRPAYQRIRSDFYHMNLGDSQAELIYSY